jgi:hypothetical protein
LFPSFPRLDEAIGRPVQPSDDQNNVPGTGFWARRGNLNALEEIVWPDKKFQSWRQKTCTFGTFIGQFSTVVGNCVSGTAQKSLRVRLRGETKTDKVS